jgi:glycosyltransferase involved in cell wall biosynthesis
LKLKFVYWFAFYNLDSPSVRNRGRYPIDLLKEKHGIGAYFVMPGYQPTYILRFLCAYLSALLFRKKDSLIVIQRVHSNFIYSNLLKLLIKIRPKNTVYDLDDADYLEHPPDRIYSFIRNCSMVTVGSNELIKNLSHLNSSIVLNTSPTVNLGVAKSARNKVFTIGWIGCYGGGHKQSLSVQLFPVLKELSFNIRLVLLGVTQESEYDKLINHFKDFEHIQLEIPQNIDWRNEREVQQRIAEFDVGIATLLDDELHRCKSAFKAKQCLNNGVPVLSSNLPENNLFVQSGKNGFLCSTPEDFKNRIIEIQTMEESQYSRLSENAKVSAEEFSIAQYCEVLLSVYNQKH